MTMVMVPDTNWAREADWGRLPVTIVYYDPDDRAPQVSQFVEIIVDATGPRRGVTYLIEHSPRLRLVQTLYAGVERWEGLLPPDVRLANASGAHGGATAEIATAGLLALLRRLPETFANGAQALWRPLPGESVNGKRALVVGAGDVGSSLCRQLEALGATVILAGRSARGRIRAIDDVVHELADYDIVALATPLTAQTRGLADAEFLGKMKDGAVLINIGRGPAVCTDALVAELSAGRLRAVLDVTDPEPLPEGHPLWRQPGLVMTPHVGGLVQDAYEKGMRVAIEQIGQFIDGKVPDNLVQWD